MHLRAPGRAAPPAPTQAHPVEFAGVSHNDFFTNPATKSLFKDFVSTIITRTNTITGRKYADDPTMMAWDLINEPVCKDCPSGEQVLRGGRLGGWAVCGAQPSPRSAAAAAAGTIAAWVREMAAFVKSLDSNHLLTVGEEGFYSGSILKVVAQNAGLVGWSAMNWLMGCGFIACSHRRLSAHQPRGRRDVLGDGVDPGTSRSMRNLVSPMPYRTAACRLSFHITCRISRSTIQTEILTLGLYTSGQTCGNARPAAARCLSTLCSAGSRSMSKVGAFLRLGQHFQLNEWQCLHSGNPPGFAPCRC